MNQKIKKQFAEIQNLKEFKDPPKKEKIINVDFHGNSDLYNFIRGIFINIGRLNYIEDNEVVVSIIEENIERNFGGIDYEIDIDLDLKFPDIEDKIKIVNEILKEFIPIKRKLKKIDNKNEKEEKKTIKVSSEFLFKKIYNIIYDTVDQYKIKNNRISKYELNKCINDNINDINSRYLLLEIKPSLASLIYQNIKIQNVEKKYDFNEGSPFVDDINDEY